MIYTRLSFIAANENPMADHILHNSRCVPGRRCCICYTSKQWSTVVELWRGTRCIGEENWHAQRIWRNGRFAVLFYWLIIRLTEINLSPNTIVTLMCIWLLPQCIFRPYSMTVDFSRIVLLQRTRPTLCSMHCHTHKINSGSIQISYK